MSLNNASFASAAGPVRIPMTNDYLFKLLLQENLGVLRALLSSLLHLAPGSIRDLFVKNPLRLGDSIESKEIVLDVNVSFNGGTSLDLEMQVVNYLNWTERSLYYACRNYTALVKGDGYESAMPSIQIGLLDYTLFPEHPSFYSTYRLLDVKDHFLYTEKFSIGVVDLTNIALATAEDRCYHTDKWAELFKAKTWEDIKMLAMQDSGIQEAAEAVYRITADERARMELEAREDHLRMQRSINKRLERLAEQEALSADLKKEIAEQKKVLSEQKKVLSEQEKALSEQEKALSEKDQIIAELKAQLAAKE